MGDVLITKDATDWFEKNILDCSSFNGYIQLAEKHCFKDFASIIREKGFSIKDVLGMEDEDAFDDICDEMVPQEFESVLLSRFSIDLRNYKYKYKHYVLFSDGISANLEVYTRPSKDKNTALIATKAESKNLKELNYNEKRFDEFANIRNAIDFDTLKFNKATPALLS